jgi:hypothetical protein
LSCNQKTAQNQKSFPYVAFNFEMKQECWWDHRFITSYFCERRLESHSLWGETQWPHNLNTSSPPVSCNMFGTQEDATWWWTGYLSAENKRQPGASAATNIYAA